MPRLLWSLLLVPWTALTGAIEVLAINFALRVLIVAQEGRDPGYGVALVVHWKTMALLLLIGIAWYAWTWLGRRGEALGIRRWARVSAGSIGALLALAFILRLAWVPPDPAVGPDRWGFHRGMPPNAVHRFDPGSGEIPLVEVATNANSFRDDEWPLPAPDDGTHRVILAGDSTVLGMSLATKAEVLDTALEDRLNAAGKARWDVWNVGKVPAALWYFSEAILRIAPDAKARQAVIFLNCNYDVTLEDPQAVLADRPIWFHRLLDRNGVFSDLVRANAIRWPFDFGSSNRFNLAAFERLLQYVAASGLLLTVVEGSGRCPFMDPYRERANVAFLSVGPVAASCDPAKTACGLFLDPALGFRETGHLTPRGVTTVADALAPLLLSRTTEPTVGQTPR